VRFGLLLPHFGEFASPGLIIEGARRAEALGFDSVWVRDHLLFQPHGEFESANPDFFDPLTVLSAIGAATERITLGTATLIPFRHPLVVASSLASMSAMFGPRIIAGWGAGTFDHEFDAVGLGGVFRPELVESTARILDSVWSGDDISYEDDHYRFDHVTMYPKPVERIPFWYGGVTPASARRAARYCDGWIPGRTTLPTIAQRVKEIEAAIAENGRPMPTIGAVPPTAIASTVEAAMERTNVDGLLRWANERGKWWVKPPSGRFETIDDIEGSLIVGDPDRVAFQARRFADVGVEHLVFDTRLSYDSWFENIDLLGREVLPQLRS
jgi:alkanesulfonate monooxygenase SsuD/methylene tetrahydromethanopterin reductase-like flavin-dependent oxidoreductase (luciferase family)